MRGTIPFLKCSEVNQGCFDQYDYDLAHLAAITSRIASTVVATIPTNGCIEALDTDGEPFSMI